MRSSNTTCTCSASGGRKPRLSFRGGEDVKPVCLVRYWIEDGRRQRETQSWPPVPERLSLARRRILRADEREGLAGRAQDQLARFPSPLGGRDQAGRDRPTRGGLPAGRAPSPGRSQRDGTGGAAGRSSKYA